MTLVDVQPSSNWDVKTSILRPSTRSIKKSLGVFRIRGSAQNTTQRTISVHVALTSLAGGLISQRCTCFQWVGTNILPSRATWTNRHALNGRLAAVELSKQHNRTYIKLSISAIHEAASNLPRGAGSATPHLPYLRTVSLDQLGLLGVQAARLCVGLPPEFGLLKPEGFPSNRLRAIAVRDRSRASTAEWVHQVVERLKFRKVGIHASSQVDGSDTDRYFAARLVNACIQGNVAVVRDLVKSNLVAPLLEARTEVPADMGPLVQKVFDGFQPKHWAVLLGHHEIVRLLIDGGATTDSITPSGLFPIHLAAVMGHASMMPLLTVELDCDTKRAGSPAHLAAAYATSDRVYEILQHLLRDADSMDHHRSDEHTNLILDDKGETPLHRAAAMHNILAAKAILKLARQDTWHNVRCSRGRTALWHAAAAGAVDIVQLLIENGQDVSIPDDHYMLPLHVACAEGHTEVVKLLIQAGSPLQVDSESLGFTRTFHPLHLAVIGGHADILRVLMGTYDRYSIKPHFGVLHPVNFAAANGHLPCLKVLEQYGLSLEDPPVRFTIVLNASCEEGVSIIDFGSKLSPFEIAKRCGHFEVAEYIKESCSRHRSTDV